MLRMVVAGSSPCGPPNNKTAAPHIFLRPRSSLPSPPPLYFFTTRSSKQHVLIFGLVGGLLIATLQYTEYRFVVIEHSVELYSALVAIPLRHLRHLARTPHHAPPRHPCTETVSGAKEVLVPRGRRRPLRSQCGQPADPRHHHTRARNSNPRSARLQQSRDRRAAFRFRKHGKKKTHLYSPAPSTSWEPPAPHTGRPARGGKRTGPAAVKPLRSTSPERMISAPFRKILKKSSERVTTSSPVPLHGDCIATWSAHQSTQEIRSLT